MEIQTRVAPSELRLRDDLEEVYALFRFLGFGFRLAMSNVGWYVAQKFVILVPDPIGFAPWRVLPDPGEPCDICQHTSSQPLVAGLSVAPRNRDDVGDGVPTDQLSHNHCECTDSHCNSHMVRPFVPSPITCPSAAEAAQRLRRDEEALDAPEELRQPVAGVGRAGPREARYVISLDSLFDFVLFVVFFFNPL